MVYELYVAMYVHYTIHLYCLQQKQASKQESKQSNKPASKANKETNEQRNMPIWHEAFKSHGTLLWDFFEHSTTRGGGSFIGNRSEFCSCDLATARLLRW